MIATKTNLEITEYREKFFLGLSLRQLACFAAAAVLAIATCFVCLHWLRMDMQVVSYIVMVEVLPFLGLGFIHRDGYPFEKLVKIYWAWHSENAAVPIRPYKESRNVQKKRTRRNSECETYCRRDEKSARKGRKAAVKAAAQIRKAIRNECRAERPQHALKNGKMQLSDGEENSLLDCYQKLTIQYPEVCTAAVKLSSRQILSAGKNGLVLQVHDDNGNPAKLMVNKSEVTTSPDGEITFNVGNDFSYDLVYEDETHGTIRGAKLIQQIDEENHVEPVQVILSENQIKAISIRGVTLRLPQNGIERLFIPEKYVLRDLDAGQCTVLLYPNQQYSYVPIGDSKKRLNIQGDRLSEFLESSINPITESTGLKRKIAAVERRAGIENAKFLGKMLQGMTDSRIHTTGDYDKVIHNLGKTQIGLTNELVEVKQKQTTYAAAAKHLQICKTYKPVWMEYAAKPLNQKMEYFNQHSTELQAYRNAAAYLEKEGIDQSVEIDKVNVLAQEMGHRMDELVEQLRDVNLQEQKVRQEQQILAEIQSDLVE